MEFRKLPRERADVRALRYLNYPGVYYPEAVLRGPGIPGSTRSNPLREVPKGYVSTAVAAQMLEVSERSARALLSPAQGDTRDGARARERRAGVLGRV